MEEEYNAIENIDGQVGLNNVTTVVRPNLFEQDRFFRVECEVRAGSVRVVVDGEEIVAWEGDVSRLSLNENWQTPRSALFLGADDCRYRFYRVTFEAL